MCGGACPQVTVIDAAWLPELAPTFFARHASAGASGQPPQA